MWQSRTLWLAGLTLMSLGPLGCVVEDTDDSALVATWRVAYVGDGQPMTCEDAGTPTVRLRARNIRSGAMFTANFACQAGSGVTDVLPVGDYEVELALLDNFTNSDGTKAGRPVSLISGGPWAVRQHGLTPLDPIEFQVQAFEVKWIVVRNAPGMSMRSLRCDEIGAATVELIAQLGNEEPVKYRWPCSDGEGITQAIRLGTYANQVRLLNAAGASLSETNVMAVPVTGTESSTITVQFDVQ